jgi:hypothetical protein
MLGHFQQKLTIKSPAVQLAQMLQTEVLNIIFKNDMNKPRKSFYKKEYYSLISSK